MFSLRLISALLRPSEAWATASSMARARSTAADGESDDLVILKWVW